MLDDVQFPEGFRAAAQCRGFRFGKSRQPMTPSQEMDLSTRQQEIDAAIAQLLAWNRESSAIGEPLPVADL